MIDIKVTSDNNWVLVNHELTNSELDPIPNDDDANSGANRLDLIYVGDKTSPVKVAEWDNRLLDSTTKTTRLLRLGTINPTALWQDDCHLFYSGRPISRNG